MRPWAHYFNDRGYTVVVPLLPGHGTHWSDLNKTQWQEWPQAVQKEIDALRPQGKKIFVFGLSMGGGTTLNIAENNSIDGICLVNPMIHIPGIRIKFASIISRLTSHLKSVGDDIKKPGVTEWGYDELPTKGVVQLNEMLKATRANLERVKAPLLLFHSVDDHILPVSNSNIIMSEVGSLEKSRIELTNSYHVATLDNDASLIFANSLAFVEAHS